MPNIQELMSSTSGDQAQHPKSPEEEFGRALIKTVECKYYFQLCFNNITHCMLRDWECSQHQFTKVENKKQIKQPYKKKKKWIKMFTTVSKGTLRFVWFSIPDILQWQAEEKAPEIEDNLRKEPQIEQ